MQITPEQAAARAVNDLQLTRQGFKQSHPRYMAEFTTQGLLFTPGSGAQRWAWRLSYVGTALGENMLLDLAQHSWQMAVQPHSDEAGTMCYTRGRLVEQYMLKQNTIEQQFILTQPLALGGADFEIAGEVSSAGVFEANDSGWQWRLGESIVTLSKAIAYDAAGAEIPLVMSADAGKTRITLDGAALASAAYPVTVDPAIGVNDFRISDMGPDGNNRYDVGSPVVAYNSTNNEYLVVWEGDDNIALLVDYEDEIYGQRLDAGTGTEVGANDFRISDMGPDGDSNYDARRPAVAYNPINNEYLAVWCGNDNTPPLVWADFEIFGQRLVAATGAEAGVNDFRISDMGPDGVSGYGAESVAVAYSLSDNGYLVVWDGQDNVPPLVNDEIEILAQRLDATGTEVGANDFRLSDMGPDGDPEYLAYGPAVTYNPTADEYLVVWSGFENTASLVLYEYEIYGQRWGLNKLFLPMVTRP